MGNWTSTNPGLVGAFEPVFDERDDVDLTVEGTLPAALSGVYMRNGPNPLFAPDDAYAYPFDGTGMVHAVYLGDGRAQYRNRWVRTAEFEQERAAQRRIYHSTFAGPPNANLANTNIILHAGRYLALYEAGRPYELDYDVNTKGEYDFGGQLPGAMSAHPKIDPITGELLSIEYDLATGILRYLRVNRSGSLDRIVPFQSPWPAMVHDIALTAHHIVIFICPLVINLLPEGPPADWQPQRGTMIGLVPRDARDADAIRWIAGPPFFNWHTVSAFEQDGKIEVIFPWYESYSFTSPAGRVGLHRVVIDINRQTVADETIDDQFCEFGRINDAFTGRQARYCYAAIRSPYPEIKTQRGAFEAIARYDLRTGDKTVHRFAPGVTTGEPVFAADPLGSAEDDGFVLAFTHDTSNAHGALRVMDARNLSAEPVAIVHLPRRVPAGLHGSWMPNQA